MDTTHHFAELCTVALPNLRGVLMARCRLRPLAVSAVLLTLMLGGNALGGTPIKLNGPLVPQGDVLLGFQITPDSSRVVYLADQDTDGVDELYGVPITGGTPIKLNGPMVSGGNVLDDFLLTPDSSRVLYRADQEIDGVNHLYSVPITGGTPSRLNGALVSEGDVYPGFQVTADGDLVVYKADQNTNGVCEIFGVPVSGGAQTRLNAPLAPGMTVDQRTYFSGFALTSDGSQVIYHVGPTSTSSPEPSELYRVALAGGRVTNLSGPLPPEHHVYSGSYKITRDDSRVVYAVYGPDNRTVPYSVSITGDTPTQLGPSDAVGGVHALSMTVTPDSSRVIYKGQLDTAGVNELYSEPITGGTVTKLNDPSIGAVRVGDLFLVTPDGSRVVYTGFQSRAGPLQLYSVPTTGGTSVPLNPPLAPGRNLKNDFQITLDGTRVVYRADQDAGKDYELYSVPITGGTPLKLNGPLTKFGGVVSFQITPDGRRVVYLADQSTNEVGELYSVPVTGGAPIKIAGPSSVHDMVDIWHPDSFEISPDSKWVVYRAYQSSGGTFELYSTAVVPEPPTVALALIGLIGLLGYAYWNRHAAGNALSRDGRLPERSGPGG